MQNEIEILFDDEDIVVCVKPVGILSEVGTRENPGLPAVLSEKYQSEIYPVHRLDKAVGGLMVFAKNSKSAAKLSAQIVSGEFVKYYYALVYGEAEKEATLEDLLFKDVKTNKTYVVKRERKGVKKAKLFYERIARSVIDDKPVSLVKIRLYTGRSHQIRVQFASRKMPLVGDRRYGSKDGVKDVELYSCCLKFAHPTTGENLVFESKPNDNLLMTGLIV